MKSTLSSAIVTPLLVLSLLFSSDLHIVVASEITGTLSSDGEAKTEDGVLLNEPKNEAGNQIRTQNGFQLQGSVIGGREGNATMALSETTSWNSTAIWTISITVIIIAALAYFSWRRRQAT